MKLWSLVPLGPIAEISELSDITKSRSNQHEQSDDLKVLNKEQLVLLDKLTLYLEVVFTIMLKW